MRPRRERWIRDGAPVSTTFAALRVRNYRLFAVGSLVSNTGTWMQRVAQDWLVLALTGSAGALGITTGLQFLPIVLFSPIAGVVADRYSKRIVLAITQVVDGRLGGGARRSGRHGLGRHVAHLRPRLPVRHGHGVRRTDPPGLRQRDGRPIPARERGRPELGLVQPRPDDRPGRRRNAHRVDGLGGLGDRVGDPAQLGQLRGGDRLADPDAGGGADAGGSAAAGEGPAAGRHPLRPLAARHHAGDGDPVLRRHVRAELPDDDRADGDRGLRQGRRRVRRARLGPGDRVAGRIAVRGSPRRLAAAAGRRGRRRVRNASRWSPASCRRT